MKYFHAFHWQMFLTVPLLGVVSCSGTEFGGSAADRGKAADLLADEAALAAVTPVTSKDLCGPAAPGFMRCHAKVVTDASGEPIVDQGLLGLAAPSGFGAADIQSAYKLPTTGGAGRTVAIVDAYDAPNAESGLATYRTQYGLSACTTANGCFKKVNQNGQTSPLPKSDSGWAGEIMLDLDMVSAACPDCKILLVEADSANTPDLGAAVNTAAMMGASAISNSYGGAEDSTVTTVSAQYYKHPGVLVTVSSGDSGYGVEFPASSEFVMAVGGTNLAKSTSTRGWAEKAWSSAGSGCSKYITKPTWEKDTACTKRMESDVSAVADPATGVAVYDGGWQVVGGTSASAPIVAGIFTLFNLTAIDLSWPYDNAAKFNDVTTGSNGSCTSTYQCQAAAGYDGPTGIGTPNGSAFSGTTPPPTDAGTGGTGGGSGDAAGGSAGAGGAADSGRGGSAGSGGNAGTGGATGGSGGSGGTSVDAAGGTAGAGGTTDAGRGGSAGSSGTAGTGGATGGSGGTTGGSGGATGGTGGSGGSTGGSGGGGSAGKSGSGGATGGSGGSTSGGSSGRAGSTPPPGDPGCGGCAVASSKGNVFRSTGGLVLLAAAIAGRRRRRAR
jgi:hypothetical protein